MLQIGNLLQRSAISAKDCRFAAPGRCITLKKFDVHNRLNYIGVWLEENLTSNFINRPDESLQKYILSRGCARAGHGVIGAHFAKMTPNFGFLRLLGVIHDPFFQTLGNSLAGNDPQSQHFDPQFVISSCFRGHPRPPILKPSATPDSEIYFSGSLTCRLCVFPENVRCHKLPCIEIIGTADVSADRELKGTNCPQNDMWDLPFYCNF